MVFLDVLTILSAKKNPYSLKPIFTENFTKKM